MPEDEQKTTQVEMKQTAGQLLGEAKNEMIARVLDDQENINIVEWYQLLDTWMLRPETKEAFAEVLEYCRRYENRRVLSPGRSRIFKEAFLRYASIDLDVTLLEKLRDPILWAHVKTASRRQGRRPMSSIAEAFK